MGKYLPVIKTAECKSLTKAGQVLGYTQPSLSYIINNIENELGCKLFHRDQRGVVLTETGERLLEQMKKIEEQEEELHQLAKASQNGLLRVGIFPSVASQWMPGILEAFYREYPQTMVKLDHQSSYLYGEMGVREHKLDCCFFTGTCPRGLETVALYEDPYFLVVHRDDPLASYPSVRIEDFQDRTFIPNNESWDEGSSQRELYQVLSRNSRFDFQAQENTTCIALVEQGLGITLLPRLTLLDLAALGGNVVAIPLEGDYVRRISLLCPAKDRHSPLLAAFLRITKQKVEQWETAKK